MSYVEKLDVIINKITKANYDAKVASGEITTEMIEDQAWLFIDDQFLSEDNLNKLIGIESGAQVNIIEGIKVNGTTVSPSAKVVNIVVPTKLSDLSNDANYVQDANYVHTDYNYSADEQGKVEAADKVKHSHSNADILNATTASYTTAEKNKLNGVATGAQVNVIEEITLNGEAVSKTGKSVDIQIAKSLVRVWS